MSIGHEMPGIQIRTDFEYGSLDAETRIVVQQKTGEIRDRIKRSAQDMVEIGERLIDIKGRLGHGRFLAWLKGEFDWSVRTADNLMSVAEAFKFATVANLTIGQKALYALSSPSVPEEARIEAVALAENGHLVTHAEARRIIADHKAAPVIEATPPEDSAFDCEEQPSETGAEEDRPEPESTPTVAEQAAPWPGDQPMAREAEEQPVRLQPRDESEADRWASFWMKRLDDWLDFVTSLSRRGGIVELSRSWPAPRKEQARQILGDLRTLADQSLRELEEVS